MLNTGDEWRLITGLLPAGWEEAARTCGAFKRARFMQEPGELLRLLLYHAVNDGSLRTTVTQAKAAGIASMSPVALFKRLRTSAAWLEWIAAGLCQQLRDGPPVPEGLRLRAIDGSSISKPGSKGTDWRLHYMLDLRTLACDWLELTDASGGEAIARAPVKPGDVILGDRNFSHLGDLQYAASRGAHVLVRLRWRHAAMRTPGRRKFRALDAVEQLKVGEVGSWPVHMVTPEGTQPVSGRVVAVRLPAPLARLAEKRAQRRATRKGRKIDPRTLRAAHFVMIFTTVPEEILSDEAVLELYRFRWQIEIAFKRHKQLLRLGRLPHMNPETGRSWIMAKLVVALLLEKLYRTAGSFSPWGYRIATEHRDSA
jgi:hypothetical protein